MNNYSSSAVVKTGRKIGRATRDALRVAQSKARQRSEWRHDTELIAEVRPYTMVLEPALLNLLDLVRSVQEAGIAGDFVECGVWRGGSAFLMAKQLQQLGEHNRTVWLCDSFEGLPPPQQVDGPAALAWAEQKDSPGYFENCRASVDDVQESMERLGLSSRVKLVQGWFNETLPAYRERIGPIALLRIDCDWYDSVWCCLDELYDQVASGGVIILDDYYTWDGCTLATHEFLSKRRLSHRILSVNSVVAYFFKQ